jgi:hypothetical protein
MRKYSKAAVIIGAAAGLVLCVVFLGREMPAHASGSTQFLVTLYGWPDNSPPGGDIAYPVIHKSAGGTGTYSDPITAASDKAELPVGTKLYVPFLHRYFILEDDCTECDEDWTGHGPDGGPRLHHVDLWVGGQGAQSNKAVINCEDDLTKSSAPVIVDPPSSEPVDTTPLFDSSNDACYHPGSFQPSSSSSPPVETGSHSATATPSATPFATPSASPSAMPSASPSATPSASPSVTPSASPSATPSASPSATPSATPTSPGTSTGPPSSNTGAVTGVDGLCVEVRGAMTADFTPVQVAACNGTSAQHWTVAGNRTLRALGKCMGVHHGGTANGTTVDLYHCNKTGGQVWRLLNDGSLFNPQSGKCLDDTGKRAAPGTQLQIWSCTDAANQHWALPRA